MASASVPEPQAHPVTQLIRSRVAAGSLPGARTDGARLALAIEGGAMRGVVSAGMTAALEQLGMLNAFDAIYGSSAGAINGAYFIAGRAALCASSYYEEMTTRGFIDWFRPLQRKAIFSLDFVLDVAEGSKPLDYEAVIDSPIELHIIASSVRTLRALDLTNFETRDQIKNALRASSQVPMFAGPPVPHGDDLLLDASIFASIPFREALDQGCTHVLALRTRPPGTLRGAPSPVERLLIARSMRRISPELGEAYLRRAERYKEEIDDLIEQTEDPTTTPYVLAVAPRDGKVSQTQRDPKRVLRGAVEGFESIYDALTGELPQVIEVLHAYEKLT